MTLTKNGQWFYGTEQSDIREAIIKFSEQAEDIATQFATPICVCGARVFKVLLDVEQGVAIRICVSCGHKHPIGDSDDYMEDAEPEECACPCSGSSFEIMVGVCLYDDSEDVKWLYLGHRCIACNLTAVYGEWKNEYTGYQEFLTKV